MLKKLSALLLFPVCAHASFIESTIGTAVVNDATATYYNPAALTLVKKPQVIGLGTVGVFHAHFRGQIANPTTGYFESGSASPQSRFYIPSFYTGVPINRCFTVGFAVIYNHIVRDIPSDSLLRYIEANNFVHGIDLVPAVGIRITENLALGAGIDYTHVNIVTEPLAKLLSQDIRIRNSAQGTGIGEHAGILYKPYKGTLMGLSYRSSIHYHMHGKSVLNSSPPLIADDYSFPFWIPTRITFSINQFLNKQFGLVGTIQRNYWDIFNTTHLHHFATVIAGHPMIVDADIPRRLHNTWRFTLASHYHFKPHWVFRAAVTYAESPANRRLALAYGGANYVVGVSTGYEFNDAIKLDASYAHVFLDNAHYHINKRFNIIANTGGSRDGVALKLTLNIDPPTVQA